MNNQGAIDGIEYAKTWYAKWPKGLQDTKGAANFIQTQFQEGKTAAIIDGPWKASSLKEAKVNYGVATIPTLQTEKHTLPSVVVKLGLSLQVLTTLKQLKIC